MSNMGVHCNIPFVTVRIKRYRNSSHNQPNNMKHIIITKIDWIEAHNPYTKIAHMDAMPKFCSAEPEHPMAFIEMPEIRTETIETRQFYVDRANGRNEDGSPKYERVLDIRVGVAEDVQKALMIYTEEASDAFKAASNAWEAKTLAEENLKLARATGFETYSALTRLLDKNLWQRLKWALFQK